VKIVIAVHHFPPKYTAGAEWRAFRTARALLQRGHTVRVVCVERIDAPEADGLTWLDEVYEGVPVRRLFFNLVNNHDNFTWQYNNPLIGAHLSELLGEEQPDVFHLIGGYLMSGSAIWAACNLGIPVVVTLTDYWFLCPRISLQRSDNTLSTLPIQPARCARCLAEQSRRWRLPGKILPQVIDWYWQHQGEPVQRIHRRLTFLTDTLKQADVVISPSQFLRSIFVEAGIDPNRIIFLRQGHDLPSKETYYDQKTSSEVMRIGYMGQIAPNKGLKVLIEAVLSLPGVPLRLDIYGNPGAHAAHTETLKKLAANDPRIRFQGVFPREEISRVLKSLDLIAVPSMWYENSPNAILEAFMHKTPVVASRLGGMAELVTDGENGWLFEAGNPDDLARILKNLAENRELLQQASGKIRPVKGVTAEMDELVPIYQVLASRVKPG